ncbi:MAG: hypothetical protein ACRDPK_18345 [Carbonactinosporaceae bacterium]
MRLRTELLLPGIAIGLAAGMLAGGLAVLAGLPTGYVLATTVGLAVPLALGGAGYNALLAAGRVRFGGVAPAALYWVVVFPLARLVHEVSLDVLTGQPIDLPDELLPFLAFQALVSAGYGVGFIWLHEHLAPIWWVYIRHHNPKADQYVGGYLRQAENLEARKTAKRARTQRPAKGSARRS